MTQENNLARVRKGKGQEFGRGLVLALPTAQLSLQNQ